MSEEKRKIPDRDVGFAEGIDDEAVALAYSKFQRMPQFKLIRKIPLNAVLKQTSQKNTRILDFGCGTGHFLVDLYKKAKRKGVDLALYGLDITQTMLDRCQESLDRKMIEDVSLLLGDAKNIPTENDFFNIISTSLSLHHWDDPEQVLTEIHRVTKPGGHFILFDLHRMAAKGWFNFFKFITKRIVPKPIRNENEPLGSLLASYTPDEIAQFIDNTPWKKEKYEISYCGPFIRLSFEKSSK